LLRLDFAAEDYIMSFIIYYYNVFF
jgi:hypothetical protein